MADSEPLISGTQCKPKEVSDKDDINGMLINMTKYVDFRKIIILWLTFIAIHSGLFYNHVLKRFPSTITDGEMNWKGVVMGSITFMLILVVCDLLFKK
jgi:hypothetical protein